MTADHPNVAASSPTSSGAWKTVLGWGVFVAILAAFTAFVVAHTETGLNGDPRVANPAVTETPSTGGMNSFLGSLARTGVLFVIVLLLSWRERRLHASAVVAIGALFLGVVDPIANWTTFAILDPSIPHFPLHWPYFNLSPLIEPTGSFLGGYASYYMLVSVTLFFVAKGILRRFKPASWLGRRPLAALYVVVFVLSIPLNFLVNYLWIKSGVLLYSQTPGPVFRWGEVQVPGLVLLHDPIIWATMAVLLRRDAEGRSMVIAAIAQRLPGKAGQPRITDARQIAVATALLLGSAMIPVVLLGALRLTLPSQPSYDAWPFPEAKVYDPYGDLERAGKPGPFYR